MLPLLGAITARSDAAIPVVCDGSVCSRVVAYVYMLLFEETIAAAVDCPVVLLRNWINKVPAPPTAQTRVITLVVVLVVAVVVASPPW